MALPLAGEEWGIEIEVAHRYAIVFAEEMSRDMIGPAPHSSSVVESMHRYVDGAVIANQVAGYVANLGHSATANHLSRYDCMLVPLAVDAGMGEMGRLGYLMTKEFGPRQRLSAVTTDLPLRPDQPVDIGVGGLLPDLQEMRRLLPVPIHPGGGSPGGQWLPPLEAQRNDLLRLLGKGRDGLQRVHEGLSLEPRQDPPTSDHRLDGCQEQRGQATLLEDGRHLLRKATETQGSPPPGPASGDERHGLEDTSFLLLQCPGGVA